MLSKLLEREKKSFLADTKPPFEDHSIKKLCSGCDTKERPWVMKDGERTDKKEVDWRMGLGKGNPLNMPNKNTKMQMYKHKAMR